MKKFPLIAGVSIALAGCSQPAETSADGKADTSTPVAVDAAESTATDTAAAPMDAATPTERGAETMSDDDRGNDGGRRSSQ